MAIPSQYTAIHEKFWNAIPNDKCIQTRLTFFLDEILRNKVDLLIDLGCGDGNFAPTLTKYCKRYIGLDISDSPEVNIRTRNDFEFLSYDGVNLPFDDNSIDVIIMNQVLEHVLEPHKLLNEINRVLKEEGILIGSVSHLEPYHSFSILNFTPFGICAFLNLFNLDIIKLRPGIDGITSISRTLNKFIVKRGSELEDTFWDELSPLNYIILKFCNKVRLPKKYDKRQINFFMLRLCAQFCFAAKKINNIQLM